MTTSGTIITDGQRTNVLTHVPTILSCDLTKMAGAKHAASLSSSSSESYSYRQVFVKSTIDKINGSVKTLLPHPYQNKPCTFVTCQAQNLLA